jgi:hypothetical protein
VTPILVRPVREQLEHDRVIRELQSRWRRKYTVLTNQGAEQVASVTVGDMVLYPDLILTAPGARRPEIIVEVETGESVNNLEAMAEWVRLAQVKAEFHLYVPAGSVEVALRLCQAHNIPFSEICSYHAIGDQLRWVTVHKASPAPRPAPRREPAPAAPAASRSAAPRRAAAGNGGSARKTTSRRTVKAVAANRARPKKAGAKTTARTQKRK